MDDYTTKLKTIKAIQLKKNELDRLYAFIGTHFKTLPGNDFPKKEMYVLNNLIANSKVNSYIAYINGRFVNIPMLKFQNRYEQVV